MTRGPSALTGGGSLKHGVQKKLKVRASFDKLEHFSPRNIAKKSMLNCRNNGDFLPWQLINWKNRRFIASNQYINDFLTIFTEFFHLRYINMIYYVEAFRYMIYRWYITIFLSMVTMQWSIQKSLRHYQRSRNIRKCSTR